MVDPIRIASVDREMVTVCFFYPQATPAVDALGAPFTPTPSASFPTVIQSGFTGTEAADLDAGLEVGETFTFPMPTGMAPAAILSALRVRYADRLAKFPAWYAAHTEYLQYVGAKHAAS